MANIRSQMKRNRQNVKRNERNKAARSEIRTRMRRAVEAIEAGSDDAAELTAEAIRQVDRAASAGVLHKNTAARRKSRLVKRLAQSQAD